MPGCEKLLSAIFLKPRLVFGVVSMLALATSTEAFACAVWLVHAMLKAEEVELGSWGEPGFKAAADFHNRECCKLWLAVSCHMGKGTEKHKILNRAYYALQTLLVIEGAILCLAFVLAARVVTEAYQREGLSMRHSEARLIESLFKISVEAAFGVASTVLEGSSAMPQGHRPSGRGSSRDVLKREVTML